MTRIGASRGRLWEQWNQEGTFIQGGDKYRRLIGLEIWWIVATWRTIVAERRREGLAVTAGMRGERANWEWVVGGNPVIVDTLVVLPLAFVVCPESYFLSPL